MQQQPGGYYGGGGAPYPPPLQGSYGAVPPPPYPPQQMPYYPPMHQQQQQQPYGYGQQQQQMDRSAPYDRRDDDRRGGYSSRGGERERRGGGGGQQQHQRGRSRSPSQEGRSNRRMMPTPSSIVYPPVKPGEVAFTLLVPAFGITAHTAALRDISTSTNTSITLQETNDSSSAPGTRRTLRFVGPWSDILQAQRQVLELLQQTTSRSLTSTSEETLVLIPRDRAQNLTESLADIQQSTNTTVEVFPSRGGTDANIALVVVTSGEAPTSEEKRANEAKAIERIKDILALPLLPSDLPAESEPSCRVFIPVAARFAGSVIGKSASIVRELEQETKARINLSREGTKVETPTEIYRFVTAEGTGEQVRHAYKRILEHIEEAKARARLETKDGTVLKVPLSVPDHLIGVIIGRGGKVLRDLQDDTGTKIHIEHSGRDDRSGGSVRLVEITGEPEKVETAQKLIVERLMEAVGSGDQAPGGSRAFIRDSIRARSRSPSETRSSSTRRPMPPPLASSSDGTEVDKMVIKVPIHQVGAVIGNRGGTIRMICEESGARVHIEGKDEIAPDATERGVTITGTTSQVSRAFALVQAALADSNEARAETRGKEDGGGRREDYRPRDDNRRDDYRGSRMHQYRADGPPPPVPSQRYPEQRSRDPYGQQLPPMGYPPQQPQYQQQPYGQPVPPPYYAQQQPPLPQQLPPMYGAPPPYGGGYAPRPGNPVQLPVLPPPTQQQQPPPQSSQFDLRILSQLAKNLPSIGSGNITQITGSPPGVQPPPGQYHYGGSGR